VVQVLSLIVSGYVLNQSHQHWLLLDALQFIISTCWDIIKKLACQIVHNNLVENDFCDHELKELMVYMKK
jgi:hypothetical protein